MLAIEWSKVTDFLLDHGTRIALIIALAYGLQCLLSRVVPRVLRLAVAQSQKAELSEEQIKRVNTLARVLTGVTAVAIFAMATFMVLSELGINIAPVLAGAGIAGLAIGLGAQSLVKDTIGGLIILIENQYNKGDVVSIAGVSGLVEDVNLRRTILRDLDGIVHIVPNGEIRVSSNLTREWSRVNLDVGVAYHTNLNHAIEVINRVGNALAQDEAFGPSIVEPPQALRVDNLGNSGIIIKVLGVTKPIKQWEVAGELRKRIKEAFEKEGIEIPFPHMVVIPRDQRGVGGA